MSAPPDSRKARAGVPGLDIDRQTTSSQPLLQHNTRSAQALSTIAEIRKSHCSQLRVGICSWRGQHKLEIQECTATVPGMFWPTSAKVVLDVVHLPELLAAIIAAERKAIELGLLPRRAA